MSNNFTLEDFKDRMSEEDYTFLQKSKECLEKDTNVVFVGNGGEGKSTLRMLLATHFKNHECSLRLVPDKNKGFDHCLNLYETNNVKDFRCTSSYKFIHMWKPREQEFFKINF